LARWRLCRLCGLGLPGLAGPFPSSEKHRGRSLTLDRTRRSREGQSASWARFLENLHPVDWFVSVACLERSRAAWDYLFALRASRADCLLVDALRARAVRLYPRNEERQDSAVAEFWGYLLAGERPGSLPILARYDGQRPLVPWLIRVFQNKHLSELRHDRGRAPLPDDDFNGGDLRLPGEDRDGHEERWHDEFRQAARDWLARA